MSSFKRKHDVAVLDSASDVEPPRKRKKKAEESDLPSDPQYHQESSEEDDSRKERKKKRKMNTEALVDDVTEGAEIDESIPMEVLSKKKKKKKKLKAKDIESAEYDGIGEELVALAEEALKGADSGGGKAPTKKSRLNVDSAADVHEGSYPREGFDDAANERACVDGENEFVSDGKHKKKKKKKKTLAKDFEELADAEVLAAADQTQFNEALDVEGIEVAAVQRKKKSKKKAKDKQLYEVESGLDQDVDAVEVGEAEDNSAQGGRESFSGRRKIRLSVTDSRKADLRSFDEVGEHFRTGTYSDAEAHEVRQAILEYCRAEGLEGPTALLNKETAVKGQWQQIASALPFRTVQSLYDFIKRSFNQYSQYGPWNDDEVETLKSMVIEHGQNWTKIGQTLDRFPLSCRDKYRDLNLVSEEGRKMGPWSEEEKRKLWDLVQEYAPRKMTLPLTGMFFTAIATRMGNRSYTQCKDAWEAHVSNKEYMTWSRAESFRLLKSVKLRRYKKLSDVVWQEAEPKERSFLKRYQHFLHLSWQYAPDADVHKEPWLKLVKRIRAGMAAVVDQHARHVEESNTMQRANKSLPSSEV